MDNLVIKDDVIFDGNRAYVNINSNDSLIRRVIRRNVLNAYSFKTRFGRRVDEKTAKNYDQTYWARMPEFDKKIEELDVARQSGV